MKPIITLIAGAGILWSLSSCKTPTVVDSTYSTYPFSTECLGTDMDGSQTLRAWEIGRAHV